MVKTVQEVFYNDPSKAAIMCLFFGVLSAILLAVTAIGKATDFANHPTLSVVYISQAGAFLLLALTFALISRSMSQINSVYHVGVGLATVTLFFVLALVCIGDGFVFKDKNGKDLMTVVNFAAMVISGIIAFVTYYMK
jgi:hypothetical protein